MLYSVGFLFNIEKTDVVLLQKIKGPPGIDMLGKWNGVGGKIEENETPYEAMIREFNEEAGLFIIDWKLICVCTHRDNKIYFFSSFINTESMIKVKTMEEEKVKYWKINNLPENIMNNLKYLIPIALDEDLELPIFIKDLS